MKKILERMLEGWQRAKKEMAGDANATIGLLACLFCLGLLAIGGILSLGFTHQHFFKKAPRHF